MVFFPFLVLSVALSSWTTVQAADLVWPGEKVDTWNGYTRHLIHVIGDQDDAVPVAENTTIVEQRYRALGGVIEVIHKPNAGHAHGLPDSTPVVKFIMEHSLKQFEKPTQPTK